MRLQTSRSSPWGPFRKVRLLRPDVNLSSSCPYSIILVSFQCHACRNAQMLAKLSQTL